MINKDVFFFFITIEKEKFDLLAFISILLIFFLNEFDYRLSIVLTRLHWQFFVVWCCNSKNLFCFSYFVIFFNDRMSWKHIFPCKYKHLYIQVYIIYSLWFNFNIFDKWYWIINTFRGRGEIKKNSIFSSDIKQYWLYCSYETAF